MANGTAQPQKDNFKRNAWIIGTSAVALFAFGLYWYNEGKDAGEGPQGNYPDGGAGIPKGWSPLPLSEELKNAMSGLMTASGTKDSAWVKLRDLPTDDMVVAVYNVFNQNYYAKSKETLTEWIRNERYYDFASGVKESTLARLEHLNLA